MSRPTKAELRANVLTSAVEEHEARLLSLIRGKVRDQAEADDVFQDVVTEFIEAYDLGSAIDSLGAWLVTVAQNKILDRFRRRKKQAEHRRSVLAISDGDPVARERPDEEWVRTWIRAEIVQAIKLLPSEQQAVFVKHELEGKSFEQIATETGVNTNTLLARKRYALSRLRTYLKEVYNELE